MHPHHHLLMTSHVLCGAWAFGRKESSTAAFPVCTAAIKRVLLPNICVQGPQLSSREIDFFLHDSVRTFTMEFVFKLSFECIRDLQPAALVSIVQRISATMPYLETLRIDDIPEELGDRADELVAAIPSSLRVLKLTPSPWESNNPINAHQVQVLSKLPFLEELDCEVTASGLDVVLPLTLPAGDQSFFPRLRSLAVMVRDGFPSNLELWQRVLQSPLVKQLRSLSCLPLYDLLECPFPIYSVRVDSTAGSISLEPLAHIERLSNFLVGCDFSTAPDFSLLQNCRDLGDSFFACSQLPGAVDLSGMQYLNRIGSHAFNNPQASSIIFPPSLKFIGCYFCSNSSIIELDLSPCAHSLEFVDTDDFFFGGSLQKFDTTPLLGAIGSHVGTQFLRFCSSLTEVDLSGLRGVTSIGDSFLSSCSALREVDLAGLRGVASIGESFLLDCSALRNIRGCDGLSHVETIGAEFLKNTSSLEGCGFSQLVALRQCEDGLLKDSALEEEGTKILVGIMQQNAPAAAAAAAAPNPTARS